MGKISSYNLNNVNTEEKAARPARASQQFDDLS